MYINANKTIDQENSPNSSVSIKLRPSALSNKSESKTDINSITNDYEAKSCNC